jgi:predicted MFS family arabinose efflux permease
VLSLNASFMYLGFSLGAALGSFTLIHASAASLGWVAALCEIAALAIVLLATRPVRAAAPPAAPCVQIPDTPGAQSSPER